MQMGRARAGPVFVSARRGFTRSRPCPYACDFTSPPAIADIPCNGSVKLKIIPSGQKDTSRYGRLDHN
jgi:hypothetical protein